MGNLGGTVVYLLSERSRVEDGSDVIILDPSVNKAGTRGSYDNDGVVAVGGYSGNLRFVSAL